MGFNPKRKLEAIEITVPSAQFGDLVFTVSAVGNEADEADSQAFFGLSAEQRKAKAFERYVDYVGRILVEAPKGFDEFPTEGGTLAERFGAYCREVSDATVRKALQGILASVYFKHSEVLVPSAYTKSVPHSSAGSN